MQIFFAPEHSVDLLLEKRETKSVSPPGFASNVLEKRFSIGVPQILALTSEYLKDDPQAAASLSGDGSAAFDLVSLSCTFHLSKREPFDEAWVGVELQGKGDRQGTPIAWSMKPLHDLDAIDESGTVKLEAGLKLFSAVEPKLGIEFGDKGQRHEGFITAFGLQQTKPYWYFRKTSQRELEGSYRMALVIRRPKKMLVTGKISAKATVRKTAALVFTYAASIDAPSSVSFTLG